MNKRQRILFSVCFVVILIWSVSDRASALGNGTVYKNPTNWTWASTTYGTLRVYVRNLMSGSATITVNITVSGTTKSTNLTLSGKTNGYADLAVDVSKGTEITITEYDNGSTSTPGIGWTSQNGDNTCGINGFDEIDISSFITYVNSLRNGMPLEPVYEATDGYMCWGDNDESGSDIDYNDFVMAFSYTPGAVSVDDKANGSDGPIYVTVKDQFTITWTSKNATSCTGSNILSGYTNLSNTITYILGATGERIHTTTCSNASGSATDTVIVYGVSAPTVDVTSPSTATAPASYSAAWTSANASTCTGSNRFSGYSGTSGSRAESGLSAGTYTYTMTCYNQAGTSASDTSSTVVYAAPTVDVKVNSSDGPVYVTSGSSYSVSWTSSNASSCSGSSQLSGYTSTSGSFSTSKSTAATYTYTMTCSNAAGTSVSDSAIVYVVSKPSVSVSSPSTATAPASYTATWSSSNATSCTGSNRFSGYSGTSGSRAESSVSAGTYTYSMTCYNQAGTSASASSTTTVYALPTVDVKLDGSDTPTSQSEPASYTVTWTSANATACTGGYALSGQSGTSGSIGYSGVLQGSYTYSMTCQNALGNTATDSVTIQIYPLPPTVDLKVDDSDGTMTYVSPADFTLSWTSDYATSCEADSDDDSWTGSVDTSGSDGLDDVEAGAYEFSITCSNISGEATDSVKVIVLDPLSGTISAQYATLIWLASNLDQPAQTLSGTVTGGDGIYDIRVVVTAPSGTQTTYSRSDAVWTLGPDEADDPDFGTLEEGEWSAYAVIEDSRGSTFTTNSVTWEVKWYQVHAIP